MSKLCQHRDKCGGCTSQETPYEEQLAQKMSLVQGLFPSHPIEQIVGSPHPWHYRGKMEFSFSEDLKGGRYLGLYMPNSRGKIVNLSECLIAKSHVNKIFENVQQWWQSSTLQAYFAPKDKGSLQTLTLRSGINEMVILTVSGNSDFALTHKDLDGFVKAVQLLESTSVYLIIKKICKKKPTEFYEMHLAGPTYLEETLLGQTFRISPQAFFQPNRTVAEKMFQHCIDILKLTGQEKVLDLYCGMGVISMLLAPHVLQVIGLEINSMAVCDAKDNVERLGHENVQIYQGDVSKALENTLSFFHPDIIIIDPPRSGLDENTRKLIEKVRPKKLLYISCNPKTQAEDLAHLPSFQIQSITPFDQFPHTPHVENIILLTSM